MAAMGVNWSMQASSSSFSAVVKNTFIDVIEVSEDVPVPKRSLSMPALPTFEVDAEEEEHPEEPQEQQLEIRLKNTFVEFVPVTEEPRARSRSWHEVTFGELAQAETEVTVSSSECEQISFPPSDAEEGLSMVELHYRGRCVPCLFFTRKSDGCRKGDACEHCHLCTKQEAKTRRNRIQLETRKRRRDQLRTATSNASA
mmetsp:Transcript_49951/g.119181  ORF Transcript_49951/g.119181 Transcript_49951/m.119181 type:complete len:199 (+) Transcript_49951:76-672(+)|eukprot:CAMPEP_0181437876 /NCGR_PEP_ID=MMETSP1110-20121109/21611_1 /TAXON_ID=174948 /ORGANISM="Symbiodinium sp., Strain CCMP421" /LENGTH=198 /DNA_ID=CAMNT_0023561529 /DNA_START=74 /DNA_END=670 /DNA_ORIENTATION=+